MIRSISNTNSNLYILQVETDYEKGKLWTWVTEHPIVGWVAQFGNNSALNPGIAAPITTQPLYGIYAIWDKTTDTCWCAKFDEEFDNHCDFVEAVRWFVLSKIQKRKKYHD